MVATGGIDADASHIRVVVATAILAAAGCGGTVEETPTPPLATRASVPADTATPAERPQSSEEASGRDLFISKGCAACHGQNAEGSSIAPALPGHTEEMVKRQVRNPRLQMPAFSESQVSDDELEAIAHYVSSLSGDGHAHPETIELAIAVEMHHWMALEALKVDDQDEAIHHVQHIIDLLEPGPHHDAMVTVLQGLQAGETHGPEHDIEGMLAESASPGLTLLQLHLKQASVALAVDDSSDAQHHVSHAQESADATAGEIFSEISILLREGNLHSANHEIEELLGEGEGNHDE